MKQEQVQSLLKMLRSRYPEYYAAKNKEQITAIYNSFVAALQDVETPAVIGAVDRYLTNDTSGFPPTAAQLRTKAKAMPGYMWEQELEEKKQEHVVEKIAGPGGRTRREILLQCAASIAIDAGGKEELQNWWNTYADPDNPLTENEVQTIWRKD